jgi:hypothetical protein
MLLVRLLLSRDYETFNPKVELCEEVYVFD